MKNETTETARNWNQGGGPVAVACRPRNDEMPPGDPGGGRALVRAASHGPDLVPPGTFHGPDLVPPGTFHGPDLVPPGTFHGPHRVPRGNVPSTLRRERKE
jgi:hypothetical protein